MQSRDANFKEKGRQRRLMSQLIGQSITQSIHSYTSQGASFAMLTFDLWAELWRIFVIFGLPPEYTYSSME